MAFRLTVTVGGIDTTIKNMGRLRRNIRETNAAVTEDGANTLLYVSQGLVPWLSGRLHDAGFAVNATADPNVPMWLVGYDTALAPYGPLIHDRTGVVHPTRGPRPENKQDHFLSEPRDQLAAVFLSVLKQQLEGTISRMSSISRGQKSFATRFARGL